MPTVLPTLEVISTFATGAPSASLHLFSCETTEQLDYNDTLTARIAWPPRVPVRKRTALRLTGADGVVREFRVQRVQRDVAARVADLSAVSPLLDLSTCGLARLTSDGAPRFAFAFTGTLLQWLSTVVLPSLAACGVTWVSATPGPIDGTEVITREFARATPLAVLNELATAAGKELTFAQPVPGSLYRLGFAVQRAAASNGRIYAAMRNVLEHDEDSSDESLVSHIGPYGGVPAGGTEPATIGDNVWQVTAVSGGWVGVADPAGGAFPVAFDDMLNGATLIGPLNSASAPVERFISDSRAGDSAVFVADTAGLAPGDLVQVAASTGGVAITELVRPMIAEQFGRVYADLPVENGRGEGNRLRDPSFSNGLSFVSAVNSAAIPPFAEIRRSELGLTVSGQIAAARAAGTTAATPVQLKGLPASSFVRQQDRIEVAGGVVNASADVIPAADGSLSIPVSPGLPGSQPDGTPITLTRATTRALTLAGVHPTMAPVLVFTDSNTDGLPVGVQTYFVSRTGQPSTTRGGSAIAYRGGDGIIGRPNPISASGFTGLSSIQAGGLVIEAAGLNLDASLTQPTLVRCNAFSDGPDAAIGGVVALNALPHGDGTFNGFALQVAPGSSLLTAHPALGTVGTFVNLNGFNNTAVTAVDAGGVLRAYSGRWVGVIESVAPSGGNTLITCRLWVPPGFDRVHGGAPVTTFGVTNSASAPDTQFTLQYAPASATFPNADAWTLQLGRESRPLLLNGSHAAGATTINTKADSTIARRNWQAGDTLNFRRNAAATVNVTAATSTPLFEEDEFGNPITFLGTQYAITFDPATSSIDEAFTASDVPASYVFPEWGVGFNASSLSGSTLNGWVPAGFPTPSITPQLYSLTWETTDTYTVSGAVAWGSNGRATIPITAAIPAGRTYPRGRVVYTNWTGVDTTSGRLRLFTSASAGATSFEVIGIDRFTVLNAPTTGGLVGLWRIEANSAAIPFPGEVMLVSQTVQADASGNANVTITGPNTNALALNAAFSISRPNLLRPGVDSTAGSVIRLLSPPNNSSIPLPTTPAARFEDVFVSVPAGRTRSVTAFVQLALGPGTYALGNMPCIGIHGADGTVLGFARVADSTVVVNNVAYVRLIAQATLTASQPVHVRVSGMPINAGSQWAIVLDRMLAITAATDAPIVNGSHANRLWQAAVNRLRVYGRDYKAVTLRTVELQFAGAPNADPFPVVGATVTVEDTGDVLRVASLTVDHFDPLQSTIGLDTLRPLLSRLIGAGS